MVGMHRLTQGQDALYEVMTLMVKKGPLSAMVEEEDMLELKA
jgi:agmatinase